MKSDPPHILCVNPWIHDFAAFDFWARPLGLLSLAALLRKAGLRISWLDCLDRFLPGEAVPGKTLWDGRGPYAKTPLDFRAVISPFLPSGAVLPETAQTFSRYGISPERFVRDMRGLDPPDLILVTSIMTYWASGVAETISRIKTMFPDVPVVLGGIYATLCTDHAIAFSGADRVVPGPGEGALAHIVQEFTGFKPDICADPDNLDSLPFPALDLQNHLAYAPILTSRGCPFACDYCASSFLEPRLRRRSPDHVLAEIRYWHRTQGVRNFAFYDDALLVNGTRYAFPLLEKIISSGMALQFHTPNALHIREIDETGSALMFRAGFKTIRLGLETTHFDDTRNHDIKVRKDEFSRAVQALKTAGFTRDQVGAYLLCGLPGQDLEEVRSSMERVKDAGITPVLAYYTPIPHTPLWDQAEKMARFDIRLHPVLTNNTLFPCVQSPEDIRRIHQLKTRM